MTIIDQHGKPFKPDPVTWMLRMAQPAIVTESVSPQPAGYFDIARLRQSCGAPPQTITFRRHSPFKAPTP
jgi:hypothetical protein